MAESDLMASSTITCSLCVEWLNQQKSVIKKTKCKTALLELVRNEFRDLFLKITGEGLHLKLLVNNLTMHKKFITEGKATINFSESKTIIYISNAPTSNLILFLKTVFIKMTSRKSSPKVPLREQFLSNKPNIIQEISPINVKDVTRVKKDIVVDVKKLENRKKRQIQETEKNNEKFKKQCSSNIVSLLSLTEEQNRVLNAVKEGHNVFFTGSAGTGKSFLLRHIINSLPPDVTVATASTGAASCLIGGVTLHSFAGIGSGEGSLEKCLQLAERPQIMQNWKRCRHLVIDEISMVNGWFFEKLDKVARRIRKCDKPFGGLQLILSGDFLQLPPVCQDSTAVRFCFQTTAWKYCNLITFQLKQVHRQSDPDFISMLNSIRIGQITPEIAEKLVKTGSQTIGGNGIQATRLCCYTQEANLINATNLDNIKEEPKEFEAVDNGSGNSKMLDELTPVPKKIVLKVGAQVMLLKNINVAKGLVNGARGVLTKFVNGLPVVKFLITECTVQQSKWVVRLSSGNIISRQQLPLRLAWAFSIHKSQGLTLDCVEMTLAQVFEAGQAYVALSRAKNLSSLRVIDFDIKKVWANPDVLNFYRKLTIFEKKYSYINQFIPLGPNHSNKRL
ncbi:pif1 DNA helicase [Lycorma delicatula]|uniref:pif1 DNA helicase n=1 Tax=Lycorma delicatula TaxID=130591 RepID=UPI003F5132F3